MTVKELQNQLERFPVDRDVLVIAPKTDEANIDSLYLCFDGQVIIKTK